MKKILLLILVLILTVPSVVLADISTQTTFSTTILGLGAVIAQPELSTVKLDVHAYGNEYLKAIVEKDDTEYIYNLVSDIEIFPLQMGSGKYNVSILGSNDGRRFKLLDDVAINVTVEENIVFLTWSQTVDWNEESEVAILARELVKDVETDQEKFDIIFDYIIHNVSYDYVKSTQLPKGYIPNADETLEEGLGICYDFAALLASMCRSVDIPTKLVKGYSSYTPVYHAWNEVLLDGEWKVIDTSTDSIFVQYKVTVIKEKSVNDYLPSKFY